MNRQSNNLIKRNNYSKNSTSKNGTTKNNKLSNSSKNLVKKFSMSFIFTIIGTLIIIIACVIILIVIARNTLFITNMNNHLSPIFIIDDIDARKLDSDLVKNAGNEVNKLHNHSNFTFSTWVYIQDWSYNQGFYKVIFRKGSSENNTCRFLPLIALDKYENNLIFAVDIYDGSGTTNSIYKCVHKNIPLQKWVNIVYIVSDRKVSLFIDGNIEKECRLPTIPYKLDNNSSEVIDILGKGIKSLDSSGSCDSTGMQGFYGKVSKMQYFAKHLSNDEIRKIYENGPYIS